MAFLSELVVEKTLVWITVLPFEGKPRRSSNFSLMGSEWYLLFSYKNNDFFHVLSLHQATVGDGSQQMEFNARIYVTNPTEHGKGEIYVQYATIRQAETIMWYSGNTKGNIFQVLPSLYDSLEIKFVFKFYGHPQSAFQLEIGTDTSTTSETVSMEGPSDLECLSADFGRLLESEQLPDVRLNCKDQTFSAHRSVLAARSKVFAAMFRNRMAESETGCVDVKDFEPDVIRHFLQYLYSGKLSAESGGAVSSLYAIADKYAVDSLKRACTRWIAGKLTEGNCVKYLTVADLLGSEALKKEAIACVCRHPAVMLGDEWTQFSEKNPKLALEVHQSFVRSKTKT